MLNQEMAKILEEKVHERLANTFSDEKLASMIMKIAVRSTIITLQEYEKMLEAQDE